jgi:hypothetical protein
MHINQEREKVNYIGTHLYQNFPYPHHKFLKVSSATSQKEQKWYLKLQLILILVAERPRLTMNCILSFNYLTTCQFQSNELRNFVVLKAKQQSLVLFKVHEEIS